MAPNPRKSASENKSTNQKGGTLRRDARPDNAAQKPSGRVFNTYTEFVEYIMTRKCSKCKSSLLSKQASVEKLFGSWASGQAISSIIKCSRCATSNCVGCGANSPAQKTTVKVGEKPTETYITWCCSRGRMFVLWVLLCGFDQEYCARKQREGSTMSTRTRQQGSGTGYEELNYGLDQFHINPLFGGSHVFGSRNQPPSAGAESKEKISDKFYQTMFSMLVELCPCKGKSSTMDSNPHGAVTSMLLNSKVLQKAAELLRNDSLEEATKRRGLYKAVLDFVGVVGSHPTTSAKAVFQERQLHPDTVNLLTLSFQTDKIRGKQKPEGTSPLSEVLKNLSIQSEIMLNAAKANGRDFQTREGQDMLWICRQIHDLAARLLPKGESAPRSRHEVHSMSKLQNVTEVRDDPIFATHVFSREIQGLAHSFPGRMKRLIKEIASLKTGLPPGIFVRYAASMIDCLKFLIVGPVDTPYENGLFEFDLSCPANYPHAPPQCLFKGTKGGEYGINPNIYPNGKVCLSLLNTFPGEPWRPAVSTILQVLVSIQAMILCEDPLSNEPDIDKDPTGHEHIVYSDKIRRLTIYLAMIDWMKRPPTLWHDIVTQHFKEHMNHILTTTRKWASQPVPTERGGWFCQPTVPIRLDVGNDHLLRSALELYSELQDLLPRFTGLPAPAQSHIGTVQATPSSRNPDYGNAPYGTRSHMSGFSGSQGNSFGVTQYPSNSYYSDWHDQGWGGGQGWGGQGSRRWMS